MEVFAGENRPAAAIGLVQYGTVNGHASVTGAKTFGDYRGHVTYRRHIVGGDPVRAIVRHTNAGPPGGLRSAPRTMNTCAAMVAYVHLDTTDSVPLCPIYAGPLVLHATKPLGGVQGPSHTVAGSTSPMKKYVYGP